MKKLILISITFIYLAALIIFGKIFFADILYVNSQNAAKELDFERAILLAEKSIKSNPNEPRYRYGIAKILLASAVAKDKEELKMLKTQSLKHLKDAEKLNPNNLVTLKNMVPIYYYLALDLQNNSIAPTVDADFITYTRDFLTRLKNFSEKDVSIYTLTAKYENLLAEREMLNRSKEKIKLLRPDLLEWYMTIPE